MRFTTIPADSLTAEHLAVWRQLRQQNPDLESPFFCPEFVLATAAERAFVEVAVMEHSAGRLAGFLPFFRDIDNVARPVAGHFSDFEGAILPQGIMVDVWDLLRECRLSAWCFDHLIASQATFERFHWRYTKSPYLDLSRGFESYCSERRQAGTNEVREALRKARKLVREVAPIRLEASCRDERVFEQLIRWKKEQLAHRQLSSALSHDWVVPFLRRLTFVQGVDFSGMLSALYVGDDLAAASLGFRSDTVLHGLVMAFNRDYARYSPGRILIVKLAESVSSMGIRRIDMGSGDEAYKRWLASRATRIAEGAADRRIVGRTLRQSWVRAKGWVGASPFKAPAKRLVRRIRNVRS
jgi:CelD/BcsL family acetyltransferase involved in cellulose biosynthesis